MLAFFLRQLSRSIGVFWRTIVTLISRKTQGLVSKIRRLTNFSQNLSKTATSSVQSLASAAQSPTKREDYIAVGRLLISKALIIRMLITAAFIGALIYFVLWPFVLSRFFTARFFVEDARVDTWTGRVIVYSDKKKTVPLYAGVLSSGSLRGNGKEYDAKGLLAYEGEFQDGVRSGRGIAYERGLMVYQGEFEGGVYQGDGVLYDKSGARIYQGGFAKGLYDGAGRLYDGEFLSYEGQFVAGIPEGEGKRYAEKTLLYAGGFHEGLPHGEGVSYYPDGTAFYRGGFSAGIFDGAGTEYDESGAIRYTGAFSEGKYNGAGSLYVADGEHLDAEFKDGAPVGVVRWVRDGHLYYEGEWDAGASAPSGFGALYDKSGKQIYQGQFFGGSLDGRWLMSLSLDDLRAAMGQADQKTVAGGTRGFLIVNDALGLRVLCSYRTENQDSRILAAYLSKPDDGWARLLPGAYGVTLGRANEETAWREEPVSLSPPPGANLSAGRYDALTADFNSSRAMILYRNGAANAIVWESVGGAATGSASAGAGTSGGSAESAGAAGGGAETSGAGASGGAGTGADASGGAAETQMEAFLDSIDDMETGAGVTSVSVRPEYGTGAPVEALAACATAAEAVEMADAILTWWEQSERQAAFEENLARTDALLSEAQTALSMGTGDEKTVSALAEKQAALADAVELCKAEKKKAELRVPVGADIASLDAPSMSVFFNPGEADVSRVALTAVAYAQTTGKDDTEAEAKTKTALVDLQESYGAAQAALKQYEDAVKAAQSAAQDYSTGTGSKTAWSDALSARADAKSAVTSALSAFSRQANSLNALTGGWVSRTYGWNEEAFGPLFEAEVLPPVADIPGADGGASGDGASSDNGASGSGASANNGASGDGASADNGASGDGASSNSGASGNGASSDNGASGNGASVNNGASGNGASVNNGASGDGASANNGASGNGASSDNGASGNGASVNNGASGNGASVNNGASGDGASANNGASGNGASADNGATIDPDSDEAIYGETAQPTDSGETERINGPRIGEDGKVYPFDPEDEALQAQQESGQEQDPAESVQEAGAALIAVLETLFGVGKEED